MQIIPRAQAHSHNNSGEVSAIIHISPDDHPLSGESSIIHFGIQSDGKNIDIADCDCMVEIKQNGEALQNHRLTRYKGSEPSLFNADVPVVFPKSGAYDIVLSGKLKSANDKKFALNFATRVENGQHENQLFPTLLAYSIVLELLLLIAVFLLFKKGRKTV